MVMKRVKCWCLVAFLFLILYTPCYVSSRWEDNIKIDVREIGWSGMNWIHLAQDRDQWRALVNTVMNLWVLYHVGKF
jgi:hypothetical protein